MRKSLLVYASAAALIGLSACNREEAATNEANPGQTAPVNAAQDAMGAAVGQTSAATLGANTLEGYVNGAAMGDMYEIEAGKLAETKAASADVKAFAKMLVEHHTKAANEAKPLIAAAGKTAPAELDQRRKGMLDNLRAATGADFDKVFIDQQVAAHEEALTLHKGYSDGGEDAGLKGHAAKAVTTVQSHLDRARQIDAAQG